MKTIDYTLFLTVLHEVTESGRYGQLRQYTAHSDITVYDHCVAVAKKSYEIAVFFGIRVNMRALIRGALLHDYYLYDWHIDEKWHRPHAFFHPKQAALNAKDDYKISPLEENMIRAHMFPLPLTVVPKSKEAWIIVLADKIVATKETFRKYGIK